MKKAFVFLAAFVLIATAVFAQAQVKIGGYIDTSVTLARDFIMEGHDPDPRSSAAWSFLLTGSVENSDGLLGAKGAIRDGGKNFWVYTWWKPMKIFFLKIGNIYEDSTWAGADITGWGLNANDFSVRPEFGGYNGFAGNVLGSDHAFYTGFSSDVDAGFQASVYPVEGLTVNLGFMMMNIEDLNFVENYYEYLNVQAVYEINGIGEAALSYKNAPEKDAKNLYLQWKMPIGNAMRIEAGLNFGFEGKEQAKEPFRIGLGWGMGDFDNNDKMILKARFGASVPIDDTDFGKLGFDFVFGYDFEKIRFYAPVGIGLLLPLSGAITAWNINPYIVKDFDGPSFYAGFQFYNGMVNSILPATKNRINWAIPMGLRWEF